MENKFTRSASEIEKIANDTIKGQLRELYSQSKNIELLENPSQSNQDWGIDFFMEAFNRKDKSREHFFLLQNKGSHGGFDVLKDNKTISFQISCWHASYYFNLTQPLILMFCDTETKNVYWYAIQLDSGIESRITVQENSGIESLQLHVSMENVLMETSFDLFLDDVRKSELAQFVKYQKRLTLPEADYSLTKRSPLDENIIQHLMRVFQMFEGINVIPPHILTKIHPFAGTDKKAILRGETLHTDNVELFNLIDNLKLSRKTIQLKDRSVEYSDEPELENKLKTILTFFLTNLIRHVEWIGESRKTKICVHDLLVSNNCGCERCTFKKLDLRKVDELLALPHDELKLEFRLRKAYTYFLVADYYSAFKLHQEILKELNIVKQPSLYTIIKFNLIQIRNLVKNRYLGEGRSEILDQRVDLASDEMLMPHYFLDLFRLIRGSDFINTFLWEMDKSLTDIQRTWLSDKRDGRSSNPFTKNLQIDFARAYNFIEFNLIIYNDYREFTVLVNKALEGFLAMNDILNEGSSRYPEIAVDLTAKWLFHAEPKHIDHLLGKYHITKIKIQNQKELAKNLNTYITNLQKSASLIVRNLQAENYSHADKIRDILNNYLLLLCVVDLPEAKRDNLYGKYLDLISNLDQWYFNGLDYVGKYLSRAESASLPNLKKTIKILIKLDSLGHDAFTLAVERLVILLPADIRESELSKLFGCKSFDLSMFRYGGQFSDLTWLIKDLNAETRNRLITEAMTALNAKFDSELYYQLCAYDLIDYDAELFQRFLQATPDLSAPSQFPGLRETKNYHLDKVVDQIFKYGIVIDDSHRAMKKNAVESDYYDWLLDMDGFDYRTFKPLWILHQSNVNYMNAYRNSAALKDALAAALKDRYIEGVAKMYFRILQN